MADGRKLGSLERISPSKEVGVAGVGQRQGQQKNSVLSGAKSNRPNPDSLFIFRSILASSWGSASGGSSIDSRYRRLAPISRRYECFLKVAVSHIPQFKQEMFQQELLKSIKGQITLLTSIMSCVTTGARGRRYDEAVQFRLARGVLDGYHLPPLSFSVDLPFAHKKEPSALQITETNHK